MSNFYVVGTPIGNLEDITLRAISTLKSVDLILCEDTRTTKVLLNKYDIHTETMSYHTKSDIAKIDQIINFLEEGKNLALVSDAGTPSISDPGVILIRKIKDYFANKKDGKGKDENGNSVNVLTIPGPSALISALSISGISASEFIFLGFFPHKKGRETLFKEITDTDRTFVFYESPHRIIKTLESLKKHFEPNCPNRKIVIARELTKIYEQNIDGTASGILEYFSANPDKIRGEFVVIISR